MSFTESAVRAQLHQQTFTIEIRDSVTSTNTLLKEMARTGAPHGTVLAASAQTAGRGRMGREFYSPADTGLYFSLLLRPNFSPSDSLLITTAAAVACARVLETIAGKPAQIKWVNDIYIDGKKVCGILTEAAVRSPEKLDFAILGIGVNITDPETGFPSDISHIAGAVINTPDDLRSTILAQIINEFSGLYPKLCERAYLSEYRSRSMLDGREILVLSSAGAQPAKALYIAEDLSLVIQYPDGSITHLTTGDVSVKTR